MIRMSSRPKRKGKGLFTDCDNHLSIPRARVQGEGLVADCKEITREMGLQSESEGKG
jgi:hypothetical protein